MRILSAYPSIAFQVSVTFILYFLSLLSHPLVIYRMMIPSFPLRVSVCYGLPANRTCFN